MRRKMVKLLEDTKFQAFKTATPNLNIKLFTVWQSRWLTLQVKWRTVSLEDYFSVENFILNILYVVIK